MFNIDAAWDRPAKISGQTSEHILRLRLSPENHPSASGIPLGLAIALDISTSMHSEQTRTSQNCLSNGLLNELSERAWKPSI